MEANGFINGPTDDQLDEFLFKRDAEGPKSSEERASDIVARVMIVNGQITLEEFMKLPEKIIYARD